MLRDARPGGDRGVAGRRGGHAGTGRGAGAGAGRAGAGGGSWRALTQARSLMGTGSPRCGRGIRRG